MASPAMGHGAIVIWEISLGGRFSRVGTIPATGRRPLIPGALSADGVKTLV